METDEVKSNAYQDLLAYLEPDEAVEGIVFGEWGRGGFHEPAPAPVPADKRGALMTLEEAIPLMAGWSFYGGYGSPQCYAVYIWTNKRVLWVTQYDGSTGLNSAPRNPSSTVPEMPGG